MLNRYKKLAKHLKACRLQEDFILEEMDDCWYKMSEEEQNRFRLDNIFYTVKKGENMCTEDVVDIFEHEELKKEMRGVKEDIEDIYKILNNIICTLEEIKKHLPKNK